MAATAAQIKLVRRMVAEATTATYSDTLIQEYIEARPLTDLNGEEAKIAIADMVEAVEAEPGQDVLDLVDNPNWTPTYDLNAAAAAIWEEKAATVAGDFNFSADGGRYDRGQVYEQYMKMARRYKSKAAIKTVKAKPQPHQRISGSIQ
jgi:hypothetical protein